MLIFLLHKVDLDELEYILQRLKDRPDTIANEVREWMASVMKE